MIINGEVVSDEVAKELIETFVNRGSGLLSAQPKIDLETYLNISRQIHSELEQFGKKWLNRVDKLAYKEILDLIENEIDMYPYIKAYNCIQRCRNMIEVSENMFNGFNMDNNLSWQEKMCAIHQYMMINRYIDVEVEIK